jgi:tetratricopeptide (TPR) repeat protein
MIQDRFKIAEATLDQAVAIAPDFAPAHEALGYCLFRMRRYLESSIAYNDALSLDPSRAKAHVGLGSIKMLQYINNKQREDLREAALEHWHRALEADPNQPLVRDLIAKYDRQPKDPLDALLGLQESSQ